MVLGSQKKLNINTIAGLDGVYLYDFDTISLDSYCRPCNFHVVTSFLLKFSYRFSKSIITILVNLILSRCCYCIAKNTRYVVFQSQLSLDMHLFLFGKSFFLNLNFIKYGTLH